MAGVCLPFILMLLRLGLLFPGRGIMRRRVRELVLAGVLLAAAAPWPSTCSPSPPFPRSSPQPLAATQTIGWRPGSTDIHVSDIESPAPAGRALGHRLPGERTDSIRTGTSVRLLSARRVAPCGSQDSSQFLQQRNVKLHVEMPSKPRDVRGDAHLGDDFVLFDSSFPAVRVGPRSYRLLVGAFPPDPLSLQLTLPVDGAFTLTLTAEFDAPLIGTAVAARRRRGSPRACGWCAAWR